MHGLRHPVLPPGVPAREPDPRLERPGLPRPVARRDRPPARHEQLPRVHRHPLPRPVRGVVRAGDQQRPGDDQADRAVDRRARLGRGLDRPRSRRRSRRARPSPSSAPAPPASPPRSSSPGPGTTSPSSSAPTGSAACSATASPTSRWRSAGSTAGSTRWRPRGSSSRPGVNVGVDITADEILAEFDAVCLCGGATLPRDIPIPGRDLEGDLLRDGLPPAPEQARSPATTSPTSAFPSAKDKHVIIIGGGDTGADCLGTVHRHRCASVHQFEIVPRPPETRTPTNPWPQWSNVFRVSSRARGRGRPRVLDQHQAVRRRGRPRHGAGDGPRRDEVRERPPQLRRDPRHREGLPRRPRPAGDGVRRPREEGDARTVRRRARPRWATSRPTPTGGRASRRSSPPAT